MFVELGEHVTMRPLLPEHAGELAACVERAREHLASWTVLAARVVNQESARQLLAIYADPPRYYGIRRNDVLTGGAVFRTFEPRTGVCEIGGWLIPAVEDNGLITQAFRQMITWAIEIHGMHRVELLTSPANARARAIAERLGMTHETTRRNAFTLNGITHDSEIWSICAD